MELTVGSSVIPHTNGALTVEGKRQLQFEWGDSGQLLLTMNVYDARGRHIARLRRNQWTFNDKSQFAITATAGALKLIDTNSSRVVIEACVGGRDQIEIRQGNFHAHTGHRLEITPEGWRIDGVPVDGADGA